MTSLSMALHGSSLSCNGNVSPKDLSSLPLGIKSFRTLLHHSSSSKKQSTFALAKTSGRGHKIELLRSHFRLSTWPGQCTSFNQISRLPSLRACQMKREDSEASLSGDRIILDVETLKRDLHIAIAEENYAKAAKIRDSLKLLNEDSKTSVLAANARFYNTFRNGDLTVMQTLWAKGDEVCCVHPGARGILGYEDVMTSWEYVWANYEFPLDIELKDVKVHVRGDVGYVTCVELVRTKGSSWGGQFVTNVFERIDGEWFISIHHASPIDL